MLPQSAAFKTRNRIEIALAILRTAHAKKRAPNPATARKEA